MRLRPPCSTTTAAFRRVVPLQSTSWHRSQKPTMAVPWTPKSLPGSVRRQRAVIRSQTGSSSSHDVGVLRAQPGALGRPGHDEIEPDRRPVGVGARVDHVVVAAERALEGLPVPGPLEAHLLEHVQELIDDPLLHELLERERAVLDGREVVHREAGHDGEELPAAPEPLVDEGLRARAIVLDQLREHRPADLGVARLVALDALHHLLEHLVAHLVRERRQADELQVREPGLEDEVGRHRELDGVAAEQHLVDQVAGRDRDPVVRVVELVRPVELRVRGHELVHEQQRDLRVAVARRARRAAPSGARRSVRPKRAARRLPTTAANSASGSVAACSLSALRHSRAGARSPRACPRPRAPPRPRRPSRSGSRRSPRTSSGTARSSRSTRRAAATASPRRIPGTRPPRAPTRDPSRDRARARATPRASTCRCPENFSPVRAAASMPASTEALDWPAVTARPRPLALSACPTSLYAGEPGESWARPTRAGPGPVASYRSPYRKERR